MLRPRLGRPQRELRQVLECVRAVRSGQSLHTAAPAQIPWRAMQAWRPAMPISGSRPLSSARTVYKSATATAEASPGLRRHLPDLDKVVALAAGAQKRLLDHPGIPSEEDTATALRVCGEAANLIMDAAVQPQLSSIDHRADTAASTLLSMDGSSSSRDQTAVSPRLRDVVGRIADAAFAIVEDPRVFVSPPLLEQYVQIQGRLGRPETLPHVLQRYASKPMPRAAGNKTIQYVAQNARSPANAVKAPVAAAALDAALAAKDLDAAVGVVEHSYAAPAFVRAKILRTGLLPAFAAVGVPVAVYLLATRLAAVQETMDDLTATHVAFASILTYIGCTAAIGVVANTTANDQMRRVTWAPGTPLHTRWLREDERAALDRVACAFGFTDAHRYGEEEGADFQALREYIMRKGMLMDQIELMEGMSS